MYEQFYGFREAPFNLTPDPRFLFFSDRHREAFNHILFGIQERKGFIQLTGEIGAGKTTVCRAIRIDAHESARSVAARARSSITSQRAPTSSRRKTLREISPDSRIQTSDST